VQREALRAIVQIGTDEAFHLLQDALQTGSPSMREAIIQTLGSLRDERAAPLFVHILSHSSYTGSFEALYLSTIEALGRVGGGDTSVAALREILHRGQWWAPGRTGRLRTAAARALRAFGTPAADRVLQEAVASGPSGVKRVARAALAEAPPRLTTSRTV
jgi:HEAT repeat protein